ncbi:MAG: amino acid ABC transporter substrate-binding protein [Clostridiaceae bacterium]|nr:amino acid ABC transporter substrate-binding protein [Clostridiaceae bacterium]
MVLSLVSCGKAEQTQSPQGVGSDENAQIEKKQEDSVDTSWDDIVNKGKFVMGLDDEFAPMGFRDEQGNLVGFDIDLAKAVAEVLGVEVEFKPIAWSAKEMELSSKKIDCIWNGFTITEERKKQVLFTEPYLSSDQVIVVKKGSSIAKKEDLIGKNVGLQKDSSSFNALSKQEEIMNGLASLKEYETNVEVLLDLGAGRIDAAVMDEVFARYYITDNNLDYVVLDESLDSEDYGIGFRLGDEAFKNKVEEALDTLRKNGKMDEIMKKWFGV